MCINENKIFNMIASNHVDFVNNTYVVHHTDKTINISRDSFSISNNAMVLINQQHDGHLYQYAEAQYKKQELKDFL